MFRPPTADRDPAEPIDFGGTDREDHPVLKEPDPTLLTAKVLLRRTQQSRPERQTHHREIARDRVAEAVRRDTREQLLLEHRVDEREMHAFLPTSGREQIEQPLFLELRGRQRADRLHRAGIDHWDRLEPHEPGDLLDEITLDGDVETVRG